MNKLPSNNWYVITGGPSVGKTTLLTELQKLGHKTLSEAARVMIDEAISKGRTLQEIRGDEYRFQIKVLEHKLQVEQNLEHYVLTFFDRGMQDTLAYLRLRKFDTEDKVFEAMRNAKYKKVFLLEPLGLFDKDYARTESIEEARQLNHLLYEAYKEYGMEPVPVPVLPPKERAQFVLQHLD